MSTICKVFIAYNFTGTRIFYRAFVKNSILFLTDATQAIGKIPVNVRTAGIDLLALSAHKFYGPKGAGALYVRRKDPRVKLTAQQDGGGHERSMRSGTLNVPGIVGLGKAAEIARLEMPAEMERLRLLRDKLEAALLRLPESSVNGDPLNRLPHTLNISFNQVESQVMMLGLSRDIAVSNGSACSSASLEASHVLKAMGLDDQLAFSSIRFGLGRSTTETDIDFAIRLVSDAVNKLRSPVV